MPKQNIKLGDEIMDVVSKVQGIAVARQEYLSGTIYWVIQPAVDDSGTAPREQYIPEQYCRRIGDGVTVPPRKQTGFSVEDLRE